MQLWSSMLNYVKYDFGIAVSHICGVVILHKIREFRPPTHIIHKPLTIIINSFIINLYRQYFTRI